MLDNKVVKEGVKNCHTIDIRLRIFILNKQQNSTPLSDVVHALITRGYKLILQNQPALGSCSFDSQLG